MELYSAYYGFRNYLGDETRITWIVKAKDWDSAVEKAENNDGLVMHLVQMHGDLKDCKLVLIGVESIAQGYFSERKVWNPKGSAAMKKGENLLV